MPIPLILRHLRRAGYHIDDIIYTPDTDIILIETIEGRRTEINLQDFASKAFADLSKARTELERRRELTMNYDRAAGLDTPFYHEALRGSPPKIIETAQKFRTAVKNQTDLVHALETVQDDIKYLNDDNHFEELFSHNPTPPAIEANVEHEKHAADSSEETSTTSPDDDPAGMVKLFIKTAIDKHLIYGSIAELIDMTGIDKNRWYRFFADHYRVGLLSIALRDKRDDDRLNNSNKEFFNKLIDCASALERDRLQYRDALTRKRTKKLPSETKDHSSLTASNHDKKVSHDDRVESDIKDLFEEVQNMGNGRKQSKIEEKDS